MAEEKKEEESSDGEDVEVNANDLENIEKKINAQEKKLKKDAKAEAKAELEQEQHVKELEKERDKLKTQLEQQDKEHKENISNLKEDLSSLKEKFNNRKGKVQTESPFGQAQQTKQSSMDGKKFVQSLSKADKDELEEEAKKAFFEYAKKD